MPLFDGVNPRRKVVVKKDVFPAKTGAIRLVQSDPNRVGLLFRNHSISPLYLDIDSRVSADDCLVEIAPGWYFEFPFNSTAEIWGLWGVADGQVSVRSFIEI